MTMLKKNILRYICHSREGGNLAPYVIASKAKQSSFYNDVFLDRFVAALLAMTEGRNLTPNVIPAKAGIQFFNL